MSDKAGQTAAMEILPLTPSQQATALPTVALRIALGAKVVFGKPISQVVFEEEVFQLHHDDAQRAMAIGKEVFENFNLKHELKKQITINDVLHLLDETRRITERHILGLESLKRILYIPTDQAGGGYMRCVLPAETILKAGEFVAHTSISHTITEMLRYDCLVIHISHEPSTYRLVKALKEKGAKKIVFDLDDAFDCVPDHHPHAEYYHQEQTQKQFIEMLKLADAVITTCETLKKRIERHTDSPVHIMPAMVPLLGWPKLQIRSRALKRIVYAGSAMHQKDFDVVAPALERLLKERENLEIVMIGEAKLPFEHERIIPEPFSDTYPMNLAACGAHVGLIPLEPTDFTRCKGPSKGVHYAATGIAICATDIEPYDKLIKNGETGYLCGTTDDWYAAISTLLDNTKLRESMVKAAYFEIAKAFDATNPKNAEKLNAIFRSVFESDEQRCVYKGSENEQHGDSGELRSGSGDEAPEEEPAA